MKRLTLQAQGRTYEILIQPGLFRQAGAAIAALAKGKTVGVISDTTVAGLYAKPLLEALRQEGMNPHLLTVAAGESSKSLLVAKDLYTQLVAAGLTRSDMIVALGGGVIGDLAGFTAATLYRGVPLVQIPTTLLAQVDSSVGGKVGVNLEQGKNLVGVFYQPNLVLIDPKLLSTLTPETLRDGMAEVIKYGAIADADLFGKIGKMTPGDAADPGMEAVIARCVEIKRDIVEQDALDTGIRMLLNFGHTLGHVYEQAGDYRTYTHGQAVAAGMAAFSRIGAEQGLTDPDSAKDLIRLIQRFDLPDRIELQPDLIRETLSHDKKAEGSLIRTIFMRRIGSGEIVPLDIERLLEWI